MSNVTDKWNRLKQAFTMENAMTGMLKGMLPQLGDALTRMERPESEGGLLKENEHKVTFNVVTVNGEPTLALCVLRQTEEGMLITRTVSAGSLEDLLKHGGPEQAQ